EAVVEAAPRSAAVVFIFVTLLLDMLALGIIIPILAKLIERFCDNDTASAAVVFILVTLLLDMLALAIIIRILPKLIESFVDNDTASAAGIFGLFGTAWALMQFLFSPVVGRLSDRL